jgi:16S rRNA (guanine1207-N2)-methyltransferase
MVKTRFSIASEQGLISLPDTGPVGLVNAPVFTDTQTLDPARLHITQSNFAIHAQLALRGFGSVHPEPIKPVAASVVFAHRSKAATLDLIAQAVALTAAGGIIAVEGAKTDGIESLLKEMRKVFGTVESFSKSHGKLIWTQLGETRPDLAHWHAAETEIEQGFVTRAGVFSADGIDAGSKLLADALPPLKGRGLDLGAGWGYLSRAVLAHEKVSELALLEADFVALDCARKNVTDPRAQFLWTDALTHEGRYDFIVCNPPFHTTRKANPALGQAFITRAAAMLGERGDLWMVANRNLPYEAVLDESFRRVETKAQSGGFKVIWAQRPKTSRQRS